MAITKPVASIPNTRADASRTVKALILLFVVVLFAALFLPADALAQTTTTGGVSGDSVWNDLKSSIFSGWGMVFGTIIVFVGVFVWLRKGIGEGLIVMVVGFLFFLVPALVIGARNAGQKMSTASIDVPAMNGPMASHSPNRELA